MKTKKEKLPLRRRVLLAAGGASMATVFSLGFAGPAMAAPFSDGGFEAPGVANASGGNIPFNPGDSVGAWVVNSDGVSTGEIVHLNQGFACFEGQQCIDLDGSPDVQSIIRQTFDIVPGSDVTVRFHYAANPNVAGANPPATEGSVVTTGNQGGSLSAVPTQDQQNMGWQEFVVGPVSTGPAQNTFTVTFTSYGNAACGGGTSRECGMFFDNVRVFVSEPVPLADARLLAGGAAGVAALGGIGGWLYLRRRKGSVAASA